MGPTASGKTDLAIDLSPHLNARLISVDSALIYQGMDIGTAKPDAKTLAQYPHHLIDICTPAQSYSAHEFIRDALTQIETAFANGQTPILVGGTSFYFNALEYGLSDLPESTAKTREHFNQLLEQQGSVKLHQQLQIIDPVAAKRIHPNDQQRVTRALEVYQLSGKTLTELQGKKTPVLNYPIKKIVLMPKREIIHQRIAQRFEQMLAQGFIEEVQNLKASNPQLHEDLPAIRSVGYRQAWQYLNQEIDYDTMVEKSIIATRQLCKRQSTWLNAQSDALFLDEADVEKVLDYLKVSLRNAWTHHHAPRSSDTYQNWRMPGITVPRHYSPFVKPS